MIAEAREAIAAQDPVAFGRAMHPLMDSFSHAGFNWWSFGHVPFSAGARVGNRLLDLYNSLYDTDWRIRDPDEWDPGNPRDQEMEALVLELLEEYKDWRDAENNEQTPVPEESEDSPQTYNRELILEVDVEDAVDVDGDAGEQCSP